MRRVHQYAIAFLSPDELARLFGGDVAKEKSLQRYNSGRHLLLILPSMMDGKHSFDEICCAFGISHSVLDDLVQADKHAVTIYK